jgi:hypothetical protein
MASNATVTNNFVQGTPANASEVNTNFADLVTWINTNATHLDGTKPFTGLVTLPATTPSNANHATRKGYVDALVESPIFKFARENWTVVAAAPTGTINVDARTAAAVYYTVDAAANWTLNIRGDGSNTLSSLLAVGQSATVAFVAANGATPYYADVVQVDGATVTPKWQGSVPSGGSANTVEVYTFVVLKTAATPTYSVFAAKSDFV